MKKALYILTSFALFVLAGTLSTSAQVMDAMDFGRDNGAALTAAMQNANGNPYAGEVELDENGNPIEPLIRPT